MTLGHGVLPHWGSDKSDPALTDDKLVLDAEKFDPSVRDGLVDFFPKALHREPEERYGNAYDMQTAWRQVFKEAEQRKITTTSGEEIVIGVSLDEATLGTPVSALGMSTRARNALERANVITVVELLRFPINDIHMMRGVGNQTRREIIRFVGELRHRFPNVLANKSDDQTPIDVLTEPPSLEVLHHRIVGFRNPKTRCRVEDPGRVPGRDGAGESTGQPVAKPDRCRRRPACHSGPDRPGLIR